MRCSEMHEEALLWNCKAGARTIPPGFREPAVSCAEITFAHPAFVKTEFRQTARPSDIPFLLLTVTPDHNHKEKPNP